jgi:Cu+-exporting ATPase
MTTVSIAIGGMTCGGCVASVNRVLSRLPGVTVLGVEVGSARVALDGVPEQDVLRAIEKAGFTPGAVTAVTP